MASGRPGPLRWVYYAYGGRLSPRYAQWVLHDLTCKTWFARHLSRTLVQWAPSIALLWLPWLPLSITVFLPLLTLFSMLYMSVSFAWEARDARLYRHGFPPEMVLPAKRNSNSGGK
jgi:uncharacterized protein DUF5313